MVARPKGSNVWKLSGGFFPIIAKSVMSDKL
jgi:hypothetical protein